MAQHSITGDAGQPTVTEPYEPHAREAYMSEGQLAHFRAILEEWRANLMAEVDRTVDHMKGDAHQHPDPNDRASQEAEFNLELRTRDRERKLLVKIEQALSRIDEHEYGYCDQCGVEIGLRRLEVRPTANLCVDCQAAHERQEQQRGN